LSTGETILSHSLAFKPGEEFPVLDDFGDPLGFKLLFFRDAFIELNSTESGWNNPDVYPVSMDRFLSVTVGLIGQRNPADYVVRVVGPEEGQSEPLRISFTRQLQSRPTNIQVFRLGSDGQEVPVKYAYWDLTGDDFVSDTSAEPATFSADPARGISDRIILIEPLVGDEAQQEIVTWSIGLNSAFTDRIDPSAGDELTIVTRKPFLSTDEFEFTTQGPQVDKALARNQLADIKVVPNPYVVTNRFERLNPFTTGRGPRAIKFTHLPPQAKVRIFTVSGKFIRELRREAGSNASLTATDLLDGSLEWDLQTKDGLSVAYGVYLYHVEAPGIGETTGTFAIIK